MTTTKRLFSSGFSNFLDDPSPATANRMELSRPMKLLLSFKDKHASTATP